MTVSGDSMPKLMQIKKYFAPFKVRHLYFSQSASVNHWHLCQKNKGLRYMMPIVNEYIWESVCFVRFELRIY